MADEAGAGDGGDEVGPTEGDVLGQAEQQQEEDRQREPDQRLLHRGKRRPAPPTVLPRIYSLIE
jgi:hypothetical protein